MAIPENRLSTTVHPDTFLPPDEFDRTLLTDKEAGPIEIGNPSFGLSYQVWTASYADPVITLTPADTGLPVDVLSVADVTELSFAFDQNGNIAVVYKAAGTVSLYWYDTGQGDYTTTPSIEGAISAMLTMDDKRSTQTQSSDILLWYTKPEIDQTFTLYYRQQRESYGTERLLRTNVWRYPWKLGMHEGLRVQLVTVDIPPT